MHDQHDYFDYAELIREVRMQRSIAIGQAIANGVAAVSRLIGRANAALWHSSVVRQSKPVGDTASAHR